MHVFNVHNCMSTQFLHIESIDCMIPIFFFSVPKSAGNMTVQDPNVGVTPRKSVNSPTGHHVYGKVLSFTYVCSEQQGLLCI